MKRVFNAGMVAHVWAQATQDTGYTASRSFSFEGSVLFSYGTPIANFTTGADGARVYLISSHKYSNTTNGHQSAARGAVRHQRMFQVPDIGASGGRAHSVIGWPMSDAKSWAPVHAANLAYFASAYAENVAKCLRFQSWYWQDMGDVLAGLETYQERANEYADAFGIPRMSLPCAADAARIWERCERLNAKRADPRYAEKAEKARAAREAANARKAAREAAERVARNAQALEDWRSGAPTYARLYDADGGAYLRVVKRDSGDLVQTSQGAEVPVSHARRVLGLLQSMRARIATWERGETCAERSLTTLGHFTLDSFDEKGIYAGCHFISWAEIERIAPVLNA